MQRSPQPFSGSSRQLIASHMQGWLTTLAERCTTFPYRIPARRRSCPPSSDEAVRRPPAESAGRFRRAGTITACRSCSSRCPVLHDHRTTWSGWYAYNEDERAHGQPAVPLSTYLRSGHFVRRPPSRTGERVLQMGSSVLTSPCTRSDRRSRSGRTRSSSATWIPRLAQKDRAHRGRVAGGIGAVWVRELAQPGVRLLFSPSFALHAINARCTTARSGWRTASGRHARRLCLVIAVLVRVVPELAERILSLAAMVAFTIVLRQRAHPNRSRWMRRCGRRQTDSEFRIQNSECKMQMQNAKCKMQMQTPTTPGRSAFWFAFRISHFAFCQSRGIFNPVTQRHIAAVGSARLG